MRLVCGVDEAGRGPIAGPVYAAAVILDPARRVNGLADSKLLTPERRELLAGRIKERAVAHASVEEIDRINILRASLVAMRRAVDALKIVPHEVLVDGTMCPDLPCVARAIVDGDATHKPISAASILAKTARDAEMCALHDRFPQYGFDQHKGYATAEHLQAVGRLGPCEIHRLSFEPVDRMRAHVDLRLVVQLELVAVARSAQVAENRELASMSLVAPGFVHADRVAALAGVVQGGVGATQ